jgi:hypothetical protein
MLKTVSRTRHQSGIALHEKGARVMSALRAAYWIVRLIGLAVCVLPLVAVTVTL